MKLFYADSETTGLDPRQHEAFQWAYIIEVDRQIVAEGEVLVRPTKWDAISDEALAVNKRTREELQEFPERRDGYQKIIAVLGRHVNKYDRNDKLWWVGKNPQFDTGFMESLFLAEGDKYFGSWFDRRLLDPTTLAVAARLRGHIKPPDYKLGTLCEVMGVPLGESAHDALADVRATRLLFHALMDRFITPVAPEQLAQPSGSPA